MAALSASPTKMVNNCAAAEIKEARKRASVSSAAGL
jgi:hypothetical protein